jgi:hypothetical protein
MTVTSHRIRTLDIFYNIVIKNKEWDLNVQEVRRRRWACMIEEANISAQFSSAQLIEASA